MQLRKLPPLSSLIITLSLLAGAAAVIGSVFSCGSVGRWVYAAFAAASAFIAGFGVRSRCSRP